MKKMKKALLSTLFIFLYQFSIAQIGITYSSNNDNRPASIIKKKDGNYFVIINTWNNINLPNSIYSTIFTMNSNGKFIDSTVLKNSQFDLYLSRLIPVNDGYIGFVSANSKLTTNRFLKFIRFNRALERIRDTMVSIEKDAATPSFAFDRDSNLIVVASDVSQKNYFGKRHGRGRG